MAMDVCMCDYGSDDASSVALAYRSRSKDVLWCRVRSGNVPLMTSWCEALGKLATAGYLCVFTCANDHQDVRGESVIMKHIIGAKYVLPADKSPFSACRCAVGWGMARSVDSRSLKCRGWLFRFSMAR